MSIKKFFYWLAVYVPSLVVLILYSVLSLDSGGGVFEKYSSTLLSVSAILLIISSTFLIKAYKTYHLNVFWYVLGILGGVYGAWILLLMTIKQSSFTI